MKTCGTCKYFGKEPHWNNYGWDDEADEPLEGPVYHKCELLAHLNADSSRRDWPVAGVIDGSGYHATLCVREEFGCNQWEPTP